MHCVLHCAHIIRKGSYCMTKTSAVVNVRVDERVKKDIENLFDNLGMNISTAVNMFFRQCLIEQGLPYQPKMKHTHTKAIHEAQASVTNSNYTEDEILTDVMELRYGMSKT